MFQFLCWILVNYLIEFSVSEPKGADRSFHAGSDRKSIELQHDTLLSAALEIHPDSRLSRVSDNFLM